MKHSKNIENILNKMSICIIVSIFSGLIYAYLSSRYILGTAFYMYAHAIWNLHKWEDFGPSGV